MLNALIASTVRRNASGLPPLASAIINNSQSVITDFKDRVINLASSEALKEILMTISEAATKSKLPALVLALLLEDLNVFKKILSLYPRESQVQLLRELVEYVNRDNGVNIGMGSLYSNHSEITDFVFSFIFSKSENLIAKIKQVDYYGRNLLAHIALSGNIDRIGNVINLIGKSEFDAQLVQVDRYQRTLLMTALFSRNVGVLKNVADLYSKEQLADQLNSVDVNGNNLLMLSAFDPIYSEATLNTHILGKAERIRSQDKLISVLELYSHSPSMIESALKMRNKQNQSLLMILASTNNHSGFKYVVDRFTFTIDEINEAMKLFASIGDPTVRAAVSTAPMQAIPSASSSSSSSIKRTIAASSSSATHEDTQPKSMMSVALSDWSKAEQYFKISGCDIKCSKKTHGLGNSFIKVNREIYAVKPGEPLGKGGEGIAKIVVNRKGEIAKVKIEGRGLRQGTNQELKVMLGLRIIKGQAERDYHQKVFLDKPRDKKLYTVMEYVEGEDLNNHVRNIRKSNESYKLLFAIKSAEALKKFHDKRIVHADIKSKNIIAKVEDDNVKLEIIDLGFSTFLPKESDIVLRSRRGTKRYMAPELFCPDNDNNVKFSLATDIYALGIMFSRDFRLTGNIDLYSGMLNEDPQCRPNIDNVIADLYLLLSKQPDLSTIAQKMLMEYYTPKAPLKSSVQAHTSSSMTRTFLPSGLSQALPKPAAVPTPISIVSPPLKGRFRN